MTLPTSGLTCLTEWEIPFILALFVGRLLPHKGVADLIAALPDGLALDVVGPKSGSGYFETLKALAAGKPVDFRHDVDDRGLVDAYRRALCAVLPSVYRADNGTSTSIELFKCREAPK